MLNIQLLIIDPQVDFCDPNKGSLHVGGADADMDRAAAMINRLRGKIADIHVTMDSHRLVDISHPIWWKDSAGNHPTPFSIISAQEVEQGIWTTTKPGAYSRSLEYLRALEATNRYPHCIWPPHCLIGSNGHKIWPVLFEALQGWEEERFAMVDYVTKGSNCWTEHFSGVQAEVPDPDDIETQINTKLINTIEKADLILALGEAGSHCLANTMRDIVANFTDPEYIKKVHWVTDATSPVGGFESLQDDVLRDLTKLGMQTTTTVDFLR